MKGEQAFTHQPPDVVTSPPTNTAETSSSHTDVIPETQLSNIQAPDEETSFSHTEAIPETQLSSTKTPGDEISFSHTEAIPETQLSSTPDNDALRLTCAQRNQEPWLESQESVGPTQQEQFNTETGLVLSHNSPRLQTDDAQGQIEDVQQASCGICKSGEGVQNFCDDCNAYICSTCIEKHKAWRIYKNHICYPVKEDPQEVEQQDRCGSCKLGGKAEAVCLDCTLPLCSECLDAHKKLAALSSHHTKLLVVKCGSCLARGDAIKFCTTCNAPICHYCVERHSLMKALSSHLITSLQQHIISEGRQVSCQHDRSYSCTFTIEQPRVGTPPYTNEGEEPRNTPFKRVSSYCNDATLL